MFLRLPVCCKARIALLPFSLILLMAADPAWKTKPVAHWDEQDARHVLADSPWVKQAVPVQLPQLTAEQRHEGGATGGGKGVGLQGLGIGGGSEQHAAWTSRVNRMPALTIRWESAFPVRAAELKAHELGAPDWDGDAYVLAVYDIPDLKLGSNEKALAGDLKRAASLKREGKKDLKPVSVQLMQQQNGLATVVYEFSRSEELSTEDKRVEFVAQIERISLAQYFDLPEMQLDGKLQL